MAATTGDCTMTGRMSTWRWPKGANEVTTGVENDVGAKLAVCTTAVEVTGIIVVTGMAAVTGMAVVMGIAVVHVGAAVVVTATGFV